MKEQQRSQSISGKAIAAISAAAIAVSGGVAWWTFNAGIISQNPDQTGQVNPPDRTIPGQEQTVNIYWLKDTGKNFELVSQPIQVKNKEPNKILEDIFQNLLAGPTEGTDSTTIPQGTQLLGVKVDGDEVRINLSQEFASGGGSTSVIGRVGQIVYTATALNQDAKVYIEVDGKQPDVFSSQGLELDQPLTRKSFQENYSL